LAPKFVSVFVTAFGALGIAVLSLSASTGGSVGGGAAMTPALLLALPSMLSVALPLLVVGVFAFSYWPKIQTKLNKLSDNMPQGRNPADFLWNA
jgi:hypothetical protein